MGLFQIIYIVLNSLVNEFADHLSSFVVKFSISLEKTLQISGINLLI